MVTTTGLVSCGGDPSDRSAAPAGQGKVDPTSTTDTSTDFCGASTALESRCSGDTVSTVCDQLVVSGCTGLDGVVNPSLLEAAGSCVAAAKCSDTAPVRSCLVSELAKTPATVAQKQLARTYCATCADADTSTTDCEAGFFERNMGGTPISEIVLPLADDVARAVEQRCASTTAACTGGQAAFVACAQGVFKTDLSRALGPEGAQCLLDAIAPDVTATDATSGDGGASGSPPTDPSGQYQLLIVGADVPQQNSGGGSWDPFGGKPDPYVQIALDAQDPRKTYTVRTSTKKDTTAPRYQEVVAHGLASLDIAKAIVQVYDADFLGLGDDSIGKCTMAFTLASGTQSAQCVGSDKDGPGFTLQYELVPDTK